jgi:HTH-type transcriptional regulator/antitoxin HigA
MTTDRAIPFTPEWAVPPGEILQETLDHLGMTQVELARRTERPLKTINEIIKGKAAITAPTAIQLERVLGVRDTIWNNLEANYRAALARRDEAQHLDTYREWVRRFPVKEMERRGLIPPGTDRIDTLRSILNFFGVSSVDAWEKEWATGPRALFRQATAFPISREALAVWLRQGERQAQTMETGRFTRDRFLAALSRVRQLTAEAPRVFEPAMKSECATAGVSVVLVPELPRTRVSGAIRWLSSERALIQLSLRYKTNDQFWFTFFHEAAHLILHSRDQVFLEGIPGQGVLEQEEEANLWAAEFLIPRRSWDSLIAGNYQSASWIKQWASHWGIAPGIVVGRLQHDRRVNWQSTLNGLKEHYAWATKDAN